MISFLPEVNATSVTLHEHFDEKERPTEMIGNIDFVGTMVRVICDI